MSEVSDIYNNLFNFESKKKSKTYPIHKKLNFEGQYDDLLDWVTDKVEFRAADQVLDAGCGTGYSLIRLAREKGVMGKGISVSEKEVEFAQMITEQKELQNQISFEKRSYDDSFEEGFDKIIAIESLKHSENLKSSLSNLKKHINRAGTMIIADDFIVNKTNNLRDQAILWKSMSFMSLDEFKSILKDCYGEEFQVKTIDMTKHVPIRSKFLLSLLVSVFTLFSKVVQKSKVNLNTYLGGLRLELGYAKKNVKYCLLLITVQEVN